MSRVALMILLMTVVTYLPRVIPITFFRGQLDSRFLKSFLYYVPYAVLAALIFPDILNSTPHIVSALAGALFAIILALMNRSLMSIVIGTILIVYLLEKII